jgi:hypothetical protein
MGYYLKNRQLDSGSTGVVMPVGTNANRTANPVAGMFRFNTDSAQIEFYNGTVWNTLTSGGSITYTVDTFTGTGSQTTWTMSTAVAVNQIQVYIGGVYQIPITNYTTSGTTLTITPAVAFGIPINVIYTNN